MQRPKTVLITGVSTGIGLETARTFCKAGYQVFGSVRKASDAEVVKAELGRQFHPLIFDVTDHDAVDRAVLEMEHVLNGEGLGCLINNAGVAIAGPILHLPIEQVRQQMEVNVIGLIKVTQAFLPLLGARKPHHSAPGRIINISSVSGQIGFPFMGAYVASKHAVEGLSHALRRELQLYGIDVIIVGPGAIQTPIWNKGMANQFEGTEYEKPLQRFSKNFIKSSIKAAYPLERLANDIFKIAEASKPKVRYTMVSRWLTSWLVPRYLPARSIDRYLKKRLF